MDPMQIWSMNIDAGLLDGQLQQQHQQAQHTANMESVFTDSVNSQGSNMM